jgi:hypothetical protein
VDAEPVSPFAAGQIDSTLDRASYGIDRRELVRQLRRDDRCPEDPSASIEGDVSGFDPERYRRPLTCSAVRDEGDRTVIDLLTGS